LDSDRPTVGARSGRQQGNEPMIGFFHGGLLECYGRALGEPAPVG
jgi:hypothetical protein